MEKPRAYNLAGRNLKLWGRRIRGSPQRSLKRGHWTLLFWFGCKVLVNTWPLLRRLMGNSYSTNHWVPEESSDSVLSISWKRFFTFFCPFQHLGCTIKCTLCHWALLPTTFFLSFWFLSCHGVSVAFPDFELVNFLLLSCSTLHLEYRPMPEGLAIS